MDSASRMDRMYRWTRHVYDVTRRYYLLGRDRVIQDVAMQPPAHVLEVGCGTARNLRHLANAAPQHALYGVDASEEMLSTAQASLGRAGLSTRVHLAQGLAHDLNPEHRFGRRDGFDVILFSYVLSMIPDAPAAVDEARTHLRPGGRIVIVDFWDQAALPRPVGAVLQRWLALFGVHHRPALLAHLRSLAAKGSATLTLTPVARRYAYVAEIREGID